MAAEVLVWQRLTKAGLHNAQDWQDYDLARRNKRTIRHDLQNRHDTPGQYIECTCKTTKYIASKQTDDKARTKHMQQSTSTQLLSMA